MANASALQIQPQAAHGNIEPVAAHLRDFCGQKLVVIFCPRAADAAIAELEAYRDQAEAFQRAGAWIIAVPRSKGIEARSEGDSHITLARDPDGLAFQRLAAMFPDVAEADDGIAFLIERDGRARHAWQGRNRLGDVLAAVRERP
jgi:peroxiredoxin